MQISTLKNWTLRKVKLTDLIFLLVGAAIGMALTSSTRLGSVELIIVLLVLGAIYLSVELAYRRGG